ncbi:MAG: flavin reductase (DIM6/NTAB) family NADH-FMN oxidoreductase RutF [Parasphingorhabdus sp.]|jgi:flavin reductase (DIM6/NTAB) family NADH-FMN oxidoreductase RutF
MIIDLHTLPAPQVYFTMIQTILPRPIAWVLSENRDGSYNMGPYSYFNAVCSDPPLVMVSLGLKPNGDFKDSKINIEERSDFVIHLVDEENLDAMNQTSATLPYGESEVEKAGLETVDFPGSRLPRIKNTRVAFACERHQMIQLGSAPQTLAIGLVKHIYVDDEVCGEDAKGRLKVLADKIRPVGRIGAGEYVSFGEILRLARPD